MELSQNEKGGSYKSVLHSFFHISVPFIYLCNMLTTKNMRDKILSVKESNSYVKVNPVKSDMTHGFESSQRKMQEKPWKRPRRGALGILRDNFQ